MSNLSLSVSLSLSLSNTQPCHSRYHMHTHTRARTHTHAHKCAHAHTHARAPTNTCTEKGTIYICGSVIQTTENCNGFSTTHMRAMGSRLCVLMHTHTHTYIHTHTTHFCRFLVGLYSNKETMHIVHEKEQTLKINIQNQHTRELINARKTSDKYNNKDLSRPW